MIAGSVYNQPSSSQHHELGSSNNQMESSKPVILSNKQIVSSNKVLTAPNVIPPSSMDQILSSSVSHNNQAFERHNTLLSKSNSPFNFNFSQCNKINITFADKKDLIQNTRKNDENDE